MTEPRKKVANKTRSLRAWMRTRSDDTAALPIVRDHLESLATIDDDALQKRLRQDLIRSYVRLARRVDALLKNTLPAAVADEIKYNGQYPPRAFTGTIVFTDFVGFTRLAEVLSRTSLIETLHGIFSEFDRQVARFDGTKIKTIGDAYMAVFGAPLPCANHAEKAIRAAMAMVRHIESAHTETAHPFRMRVGIHTGEVMAGVVGKERMQFDVFGDAVNVAARFESSGAANRINVSATTYAQTRNAFVFEDRGRIELKNKAAMKAYFVVGEK